MTFTRWILLVLAWMAVGNHAQAQSATELWVQRFDYGSNNTPRALKVDAAGNIYVTGHSTVGTADYYTIKYRPDGTTAWAVRYNGAGNNGDVAYALAVDAAGNVTVTGYSIVSGNSNMVTVRYDTNGNKVWEASYDGPLSGSDTGSFVALDGIGNAFVACYSFAPGGGFSYVHSVVKYGPTGTQLWARDVFNSTSIDGKPRALLASPDGGVVLCGYSAPPSSFSVTPALIKWDANGNQLWAVRPAFTGLSSPSLLNAAMDAAGNVFFCGYTSSSSTNNFVMLFGKISPAGAVLFTNTFDGPGRFDSGVAIALDPSGNFFICGTSCPTTGPTDPSDALLTKFSPGGVLLWNARYNPSVTGNDSATFLAVDGQGSAYIAGYTVGNAAVMDDIIVAKYNPGGVQQWTNRYDGPGHGKDAPAGVALDASGAVIVAGYASYSQALNTETYVTIKYTQPIIPNNNPVAQNDLIHTGLGAGPFSLAVRVNDTDADFDLLSLSAVGSASLGTTSTDGSAIFYSPGLNYKGNDSFTYTISDGRGGTAQATVTLSNGAPVGNALVVSASEDGATTLVLTGSDPDSDAVTYTLLKAPSHGTLIGSAPNLTYTPVANYNGPDDFTFKVNDGRLESAESPVTLSVTPINDAPSFAKGATVSVFEDAGPQSFPGWATAISAGPPDESGQSLSFAVSAANQSLFSVQPAVTSNGTLTFTFAPNANGSTVVTIGLGDSGGTAFGGKNTSLNQTFTITVAPINDAPVFAVGANQTLNEDAGARTVLNWIVSPGPGAANESGQFLTYLVSNDNPALFVVHPGVNILGTLSYTAAPNANGSATVSVRVRDDGGTLSGGQDTSAAQTFQITINAVNDAPALAALPNLTLKEDAPEELVLLSGIGSGAANEIQPLVVSATSSNPALIPHPSVTYSSPAATGTLRFTPAPNANGTVIITVVVDDQQEQNHSISRSFQVTLNPVNDPPTLNALASLVILENAGEQVIDLSGISSGAANEAQTLALSASSSNPALLPDPVVIYASPGATASLRLRPLATHNGIATVTVSLNDGQSENASFSRTFTVAVAAVNDAPTFTAGSDLTLDEDAGPQTLAWATNILPGPQNETGQALDFVVQTDHPGFFLAMPALTDGGILSFTPAPDANGSAMVRINLHDSGGIANGGADSSPEQTFTIQLRAVNDSPRFSSGANQQVRQNAGLRTVPLWATAISAGPANESQKLYFVLSTDHPELFSVQPELTADGTLSFAPASAISGSALVSVILHDSGGVENEGSDRSAPQTFAIVTIPVNDAPTFQKGADQSVGQDAGTRTVPDWATQISAGPADEITQSLIFVVSTDKPALFSVAPAISSDGTLSYTPNPAASGKAIVSVRLQDSGGTTEDGADFSATQTFIITVSTYAEEIGTYNGLLQAPPGIAAAHERSGLLRLSIGTHGVFTGRLTVGGVVYLLKGAFDKMGRAHSTKAKASNPGLSPAREETELLQLRLQLDVSEGSEKLIGTLLDDGEIVGLLEAERSLFSARKTTPALLPTVAPELVGKYTLLLVPGAGAQVADTLLGHGIGRLTVSTTGMVRLVGTLADGTAVSYSNALSRARTWPLYLSIQGGAGSLSGWVTCRDRPDLSDMDGLGLHWFKPARRISTFSPAGWPLGRDVDLLVSKYVVSSLLHDLTAEDGDGNAEFLLEGGALPVPGYLWHRANLSLSDEEVTILAPGADRLSVRVSTATGVLHGRFMHQRSHKMTPFKGVIFQKQQLGSGFFIGQTDGRERLAGLLTLRPIEHPADPLLP